MKTIQQAKSEIAKSTPFELSTRRHYLVGNTCVVATYSHSTVTHHWFVARDRIVRVNRERGNSNVY